MSQLKNNCDQCRCYITKILYTIYVIKKNIMRTQHFSDLVDSSMLEYDKIWLPHEILPEDNQNPPNGLQVLLVLGQHVSINRSLIL